MKFLNIFLIFAVAFQVTSTATAGPKGRSMTVPPEKQFEAFSAALGRVGLPTNKVDGVRSLLEVRPAIGHIIEKVTKGIVTAKAQKGIDAKKAEFETLLDQINGACIQSFELTSNAARNGVSYQGSAKLILDSIDALPGIMLEVANAGPKGDMQKALDVSKIFSEVRERDLSNEADASILRLKVEERLGKDKQGKQITLEDLIRLCLGR